MSFVYTQLNGLKCCHLILTILFNINHLSAWFIACIQVMLTPIGLFKIDLMLYHALGERSGLIYINVYRSDDTFGLKFRESRTLYVYLSYFRVFLLTFIRYQVFLIQIICRQLYCIKNFDLPYLTAYKTHGCTRCTPISVGQIKEKV